MPTFHHPLLINPAENNILNLICWSQLPSQTGQAGLLAVLEELTIQEQLIQAKNSQPGWFWYCQQGSLTHLFFRQISCVSLKYIKWVFTHFFLNASTF